MLIAVAQQRDERQTVETAQRVIGDKHIAPLGEVIQPRRLDGDIHLIKGHTGGVHTVPAVHFLQDGVETVLANRALQPAHNTARDVLVMLGETLPKHHVHIYFHQFTIHEKSFSAHIKHTKLDILNENKKQEVKNLFKTVKSYTFAAKINTTLGFINSHA